MERKGRDGCPSRPRRARRARPTQQRKVRRQADFFFRLPSDYIRHLSEKLHQHFGTAVHVHSAKTLANGKKVKGSIQIDYYNNDDLTRVLEILGIRAEDL